MKKLFSMALALVMAMSLTVPAFADGTDTKTITIGNAVDGQTYTAYKVFDVTTTSGSDGGNYAYTITKNEGWWSAIIGETAADADGNYTVHGLKFEKSSIANEYNVLKQNNFNAADFAAHLNQNKDGKTSAGSDEAEGTTATINVTDAGYYFIDSNLGSLCALDTAVDAATVYEKNSVPTLEKTVKEGTSFGESADADIGDEVEFKLTVKTGTFAPTIGSTSDSTGTKTGIDADYVITDNLPATMTYVNGSIGIEGWSIKENDEDTEYDYELDVSEKVMTITLKKEKLDDLAQEATIEITYKATLDTNAIIAGDGNENTATLSYNEYTTPEVDAVVYTYEFDLVKTTSDGTILPGAKFELYDAAEDGNKISLVKEMDGQYRVATPSETSAQNFVSAVVDAGEATVKGLDSATYYLQETQAPAGYNQLVNRAVIAINGASIKAVDKDGNGKFVATDDAQTTDTGIIVVNLTGAELPSTGGMGTTIFTVVGATLMMGAAVLLVTKKKMANEE